MIRDFTLHSQHITESLVQNAQYMFTAELIKYSASFNQETKALPESYLLNNPFSSFLDLRFKFLNYEFGAK